MEMDNAPTMNDFVSDDWKVFAGNCEKKIRELQIKKKRMKQNTGVNSFSENPSLNIWSLTRDEGGFSDRCFLDKNCPPRQLSKQNCCFVSKSHFYINKYTFIINETAKQQHVLSIWKSFRMLLVLFQNGLKTKPRTRGNESFILFGIRFLRKVRNEKHDRSLETKRKRKKEKKKGRAILSGNFGWATDFHSER